MKKNGISPTDAKHRIFLPVSMGGLGFLSTLEIDTIANGRELEIICNSNGLDSETFRSRVAAIPTYIDVDPDEIQNHARAAIHKLARYGFFLRDKRDGVINNILNSIAKNDNIHTIGHDEYMDGNTFSVGFGKDKYLNYAFGSPLHLMLRDLRRRNWIADGSETKYKTRIKVTIETILKLRRDLGTEDFLEKTDFYSFYEWTNLNGKGVETQIPMKASAWTFVNVGKKVLNSRKKEAWEWEDQTDLQAAIKEETRIGWDHNILANIDNTSCAYFSEYGKYGKIFKLLDTRGSPLILATDGAHERGPHHQTAAACVLCCLDIRPNETIDSEEWAHRPMIPLLARSVNLPQFIGAHKSDIAHGEAGAFIMTDMSLDIDLPRITITDSAAIRNQVMNAREMKDGTPDRNYIRHISGGISKFFMGSITSNLHNTAPSGKKNTKLSTVRSMMIKRFTERTRTFLKIAEQWTTPTIPINDDTTSQSSATWNIRSFDAHISRPILKVSSHQLDKYGQKIKKPSRYTTVIPNISVLNANHHADRCADLGLTLYNQAPHKTTRQQQQKLQMPLSNLNFFFTFDGNIVDRHISDVIQHQFNLEKLKRLRTKSTQGLLWRIYDHITIDWKTLNLHKGLFRSILGMSNTHTRHLYKSVPYRVGCLNAYINTLQDEETKQCILATSTKEQLKYITTCTWCSTIPIHESKGNRKHAVLFCSNERLQKFRQKSNNLIGLRIAHMFHELQEISSEPTVIQLIQDIERNYIALQNSQEGRIRKLHRSRNIGYIGIKSVLEQLQIPDIRTAIKNKPGHFFLKLFHITPEPIMEEPTDDELGTIDSSWLGLMPSTIDYTIRKCIHTVSIHLPDKEKTVYWKQRLLDSWKAIISINMGRCIGLHRIINEVGSDKVKELVETFNLNDLVKKTHLKRKAKRKRDREVIDNQVHLAPKKIAKLENRIESTCNGITCGMEKKRWCGVNSFRPNSILVQRKQCMRCSVFMTAMKATTEILIDMQATPVPTQHKFILLLRKLSKQYRINFSSLMNMLKLHIPANKQFTRAQYIRKTRPSEKWKRICKLLIELVKRQQGEAIKASQSTNQIQTWVKDLEQSVLTKNNDLTQDKKFLQQCLKEAPKPHPQIIHGSPTPSTLRLKTPTDKQSRDDVELVERERSTSQLTKNSQNTPAITNLFPITPTTTTKKSTIEVIELRGNSQEEERDNSDVAPLGGISEEEQELLLSARVNIMNRRAFLGGSVILMAIEIIRKNFTPQGVFVACTEAVERISSWNATQGWERLASIFYNRDVIMRRPNGLYLIPVLENSHWYLIAIFKNRRLRKAAIIDSLGMGTSDTQVANQISQAFQPNRGSVRWTTPACRKQTNVECGSRVICAMKCLATGHASGLDFEESVRKASLMDSVSEIEYDEMRIRTSAAQWIAQYRHSMRTRAIR